MPRHEERVDGNQPLLSVLPILCFKTQNQRSRVKENEKHQPANELHRAVRIASFADRITPNACSVATGIGAANRIEPESLPMIARAQVRCATTNELAS
jgi:hypothetical protein